MTEVETMPPGRPEAPWATFAASTSTTSRPGSASFAWIAAHRPVKPPPTMTRSASLRPISGRSGVGAAGLSSHRGNRVTSRRAR